MIITYIQLILGLITTICTILFMRKMVKIEAKFTPVVEKIFSQMGSKSADSRKAKKIEREMIDDFMKTSFPELGIGLDVLYDIGILNDERYEELKDNPEILILLINRWIPLLQKLAPGMLKGKTAQESIRTDF